MECCNQEERIRGIEKQLADIDKKVAISETNYGNILITMTEIKCDLKSLKGIPAKRWENIITSVITATIAFVIGYVLK